MSKVEWKFADEAVSDWCVKNGNGIGIKFLSNYIKCVAVNNSINVELELFNVNNRENFLEPYYLLLKIVTDI